ncbi:MAG TPA: 3-methyl-2-oxobutanoate hydroxymethyltransferase [candidate division Zixibacteria bacterium]|nr:3-methyl-2-oxobutanoate hydroxymethyltransferase [candidate division Zixibacteria bacterium]MDD4918394.1 3-methyl-2-oxobutanoate hydroxymethyltransferase [candidate division Zixibacteria bacterium]MDM7972416.1 3-methyl-2-oxobutanoate hydroxymethyltransferase [candidate division Zixibacteria bacterium]HOD67793.1 3-methyl-2-oxobutanoate hydroxymethyltransferase [candidate division Zixibacteria bacterium]HPM38271.1 3-methyl-2-oxobutanoate hydroxymethyltransferase [candidate division Zixibacteri
MSKVSQTKRTTIQTFITKKAKGEKITVLTAYDAFTAALLDAAGIDAVLVGDSAANVLHGFDSTIPITTEIMVAHTAAVARGAKRALVIADMPFLSFQPSEETAIRNAGGFLKAGAQAVKIEGGLEIAPLAAKLVGFGIPVMGHIGLTPQSIHRFGGPKVQGREERSRTYLRESALALEEAGCFSIVLELMQADVAREITESLHTAATIGIGAGAHCDGQVLVINDMLGLHEEGFRPKFLREYADLKTIIADAVRRYIEDVKSGDFPGDDESFGPQPH